MKIDLVTSTNNLKNLKLQTRNVFLLFFGLLVVSSAWAQNKILYEHALENAMFPDFDKVDTNLTAIDCTKKRLVCKEINGIQHVLMVSWKDTGRYYQNSFDSKSVYNNGLREIWVTPAPDLLDRFSKLSTLDTILRLEQLLGLPPNSGYKYFIAFWVNPENLFRPCIDSEITDKRCQPYPSGNEDKIHLRWLNEKRGESYWNREIFKRYPFAQLGYTYDWNGDSSTNVGLSEFVIKKNSDTWIQSICSTREYLKGTCGQVEE